MEFVSRSRSRMGRRFFLAPLVAVVAAVLLVFTSGPASATDRLIATHRLTTSAIIGDPLMCGNQLISYFDSGGGPSIMFRKIVVRNYSGQLTHFGAKVTADIQSGGKEVFLGRWKMGPAPSEREIPIRQWFNYSRNSGFTLSLASTSAHGGCEGRLEHVRYLGY